MERRYDEKRIEYIGLPRIQSNFVSVSINIPLELKDEPILKENMKYTVERFLRLRDIFKDLSTQKDILSIYKFDSQKEKQEAYISKIEDDYKEGVNELNKGISPYEWSADRNDNGDWILYLERVNV